MCEWHPQPGYHFPPKENLSGMSCYFVEILSEIEEGYSKYLALSYRFPILIWETNHSVGITPLSYRASHWQWDILANVRLHTFTGQGVHKVNGFILNVLIGGGGCKPTVTFPILSVCPTIIER